MKYLILALVIVSGAAHSWEPGSVELVASVYGDHLFQDTYEKGYRKAKLNNDNKVLGFRVNWDDHHFSLVKFDNSYYYESKSFEYSHSILGGFEVGVILSTGYETVTDNTLNGLVFSPSVKYKWKYLTVAQFGTSTQVLVTVPLYGV